MAPVTYKIDSDPDTIVILNKPCTSFAPWPPKLGSGDATESQKPKSKPQSSGKRGPRPDQAAGNEQQENSFHYLVSSRHLTTASPWFKRALTKDKWTESDRSGVDGRFHITAEDWDAEALLIVFRILHLCNRQVPRTVSLEMLAKIAVLVDYYELGEAIEVFTDMWIEDLSQNVLPSGYCRDMVLWIWVSSVFNMTDQFTAVTSLAIEHSTEPIRSLELPIPGKILETISEKRNQAIGSIIRRLNCIMEDFIRVDYVCPHSPLDSFQCGSILLGALTKEMDRLNLWMPQPQAPFLGLSFGILCEQVRSIQSPNWVSEGAFGHYPHRCKLKSLMLDAINVASTKAAGLQKVPATGGNKTKRR